MSRPIDHAAERHARDLKLAAKRAMKQIKKEAKRLGPFNAAGQFENRLGEVPPEFDGLARTLSRTP
jgi:hypothetical protein